MSAQEPRPPQTTIAGGLIITGSVLLVLLAWQRIAGLQTLEVQRSLEDWLREWELQSSLGVDGLSQIVRVLCLIGAGAAAATAVLGIEVFRRSRSARLALSCLAPVIFVGGVAVDAFAGPMVIVGIVMLWVRPTRDWLEGRPWMAAERARREARLRRGASSVPPAGPVAGGPVAGGPGSPTPPPPPGAAQAYPPPPPGAAPQYPMQPPAPSGATPGWSGWPAPGAAPQRGPRPSPLVLACTLTWVGASATAVLLALSSLVVVGRRGEVFEEVLRQQPRLEGRITEGDVVAAIYLLVGALVLWCLAAVVLAWLAFVGHDWARVTLAVSAITAAVLAAMAALSAPPLLLMVFVLAASARLLLRGDVALWTRQRG